MQIVLSQLTQFLVNRAAGLEKKTEERSTRGSQAGSQGSPEENPKKGPEEEKDTSPCNSPGSATMDARGVPRQNGDDGVLRRPGSRMTKERNWRNAPVPTT